MSTKTWQWIHWISKGLLSALILTSASMYFFKNGDVNTEFSNLGFPTFIVYPLGVAKFLGIIMLWIGRPKWLTEWAYAGFFFNFLLAFGAHVAVNDGEFVGAIVATLLLLTAYTSQKNL